MTSIQQCLRSLQWGSIPTRFCESSASKTRPFANGAAPGWYRGPHPMSELHGLLSSWETFYVIVGSSGGALIGLQFVVITLIADRRHLARAGSLSAFGTPTVVHLAGALVVSAI